MHPNVVGMVDGLGNQLFQFAFGSWLEQQTGRPTVYDTTAYSRRPGYLSLDKMLVDDLPVLRGGSWMPYPQGRFPRTAELVRKVIGPRRFIYEDTATELPEPSEHPAWYYGYWQLRESAVAVIEDVRSAIRPQLRANPSPGIAVHVRRGDMVAHGGGLEPTYYLEAIERLRDAHRLPASVAVTVFSDDHEWCRQNLAFAFEPGPSGATAGEDLLALAAHRYLVLSASTFSWWGAYLTERDPNTVAVPAPFIHDHPRRIQDPDWIPVPRAILDPRS